MQIVILVALVACTACSHDDEVLPEHSDAATIADAASQADATTTDAVTPDAASCPVCVDPVPICKQDQARCVQCVMSPDCAALPFTNVCDGNSCKECVAAADCTGNAQAFGPTCNSELGACSCNSAADCTNNPNGSVCHAGVAACSCITTDDCAGGTTCQALSYLGPGVMTCQNP